MGSWQYLPVDRCDVDLKYFRKCNEAADESIMGPTETMCVMSGWHNIGKESARETWS